MQLNYRRQGQGMPVMLVHGLFGNLDNLNGLNRALTEHFDVITVDLRNHGQSPRSEEMTYAAMADDILELSEQLQLDRPALVGHSMGGKAVMMAAGLAPDRVRGLVVADMAPVAYREARHQEVFAGLQAVIDAGCQSRKEADAVLAEHVAIAGVRQFLLKSFVAGEAGWRFNVAALRKAYNNIMGWPGLPAPFEGPVLFIKGSESDYLLPEHQPEVQAQFPNARARVIQNAGHWLHAEKPQAFNRVVQDFLLSVS
ncbi:alpha/beta fold hydrolase [Oceanimonas sp. CHS3-5]|uniref:alpha/beta fold hydrolase n=1 Tax=Oceanimonas sp. CHS3-5 TaxID=3068186 RepID=UPI00273DE27B|nr:alpha/beta fold hydrolase [Oceanimonas sp. CHS3-5]MDP5291157.1 alpha/beta fold hydrolase [Oceanimonas sp. CHS3-5]